MSQASYLLRLPLSIKQAAQRLAEEDGISLNEWISIAVAQKVSVVETCADFLRRRAGPATEGDLIDFLEKTPGTITELDDEVQK
jgi:hypothetical protein